MLPNRNLCWIVVAVLLWASPALALEPAGELQEVSYLRTIDANTVLLDLANGKSQSVMLRALESAELAEGTPEAFFAAFYLATSLANAKAVYIELPAETETDEAISPAWLWYEHCCRPELVLANLELVSLGLAGLAGPAMDGLYATELAAAADAASQPDLLNLAKLLSPVPAAPALDLDDIEPPSAEEIQWAGRAVDINDPATWVAFRRTGDSYIDGIWLNEEFEVFNQSEYFVDFLEVEVRYYCGSGV